MLGLFDFRFSIGEVNPLPFKTRETHEAFDRANFTLVYHCFDGLGRMLSRADGRRVYLGLGTEKRKCV